jgi:hypothetical protein
MCHQYTTCNKCTQPILFPLGIRAPKLCNDCHGEQYAKDAALDNLTDKEEHEVLK